MGTSRPESLRALAVMARKRVAALKHVQTIVEAGYPQLASDDWAGIVVKTGTPPAVTARLNQAINKALKTDKVQESLAAPDMPVLRIQPLAAPPCKGVLAPLYPLAGGAGSNPSRLNTAAASG